MNRYRLSTIGAVALVLLNAWIAFHALGTLFAANGWVSHTLEVMNATEETFRQISNASSAARAYLLTADAFFTDRYNEAVLGERAGLDRLAQLTADNAGQQQRIALLRQRTMVKLTALDTAMAMRRGHRSGPLDPAILRPALADSPDDGPSVRYVTGEIRAEEQRLLRDRESEAINTRRYVIFAFTGATLLDLLLVLFAGRLLLNALERRQQLAERAREVHQLNTELTAFNNDLEERVEKRTRELAASNQELEAFSYSVSHDLRAPLRTIDGFSLALQEDYADRLDAEGQDYINRVRGGVQRMGTLIDALLQLSRVTRGELNREPVDLAVLATLVFHELELGEPDRSVSWIAPASLPVVADSRLLRITLENLIGNAWKFTSRTPDARLELGSFERDGEAVYFIRDNGAGFDMKYVDRLFTAFQRLHGDRDFKGSGIGLATVSRIIRRHLGTIWAESEIGHGATFFFTLAPPAAASLQPVTSNEMLTTP